MRQFPPFSDCLLPIASCALSYFFRKDLQSVH